MQSRWLSPLLLGLTLAVSAVPVQADERVPTVSVVGYGEVRAQPDKALLRVSVERKANTVKAAEALVKPRVEALIKALLALKVAPEDIDSAQVQVRPEMRWDKAQERSVPDGYVVQREIQIELRDLTLLGPVLSALHEAEMDRIQPPTLGLHDRPAIERRALGLAAEDGRAQAEALAVALGLRLGRVLSVEAHGGGSAPPVMPMMRMSADMESGNAAEAITVGEMTVEQRVTLRFALLP